MGLRRQIANGGTVMNAKQINFEFLEKLMSDLLRNTKASRTTLRLEIPENEISLDTIIAESTAQGVKELKGNTEIKNLRQTVETVKYMDQHLEILVQGDCKTAFPTVPSKLIERYGVTAQMLCPVVNNEEMIGVISVHYNDGIREWSKEDIEALKDANVKVIQALGSF